MKVAYKALYNGIVKQSDTLADALTVFHPEINLAWLSQAINNHFNIRPLDYNNSPPTNVVKFVGATVTPIRAQAV